MFRDISQKEGGAPKQGPSSYCTAHHQDPVSGLVQSRWQGPQATSQVLGLGTGCSLWSQWSNPRRAAGGHPHCGSVPPQLTASEEEFLRTYAGVASSQLSQLPQHSMDQGEWGAGRQPSQGCQAAVPPEGVAPGAGGAGQGLRWRQRLPVGPWSVQGLQLGHLLPQVGAQGPGR